MNTFWGMKVSKKVEKLIRERMSITDLPYEFKLVGVAGNGYDHLTTAHLAFDKIKKWAEREGAEVQLVQDKYEEILDESLKKRSPYSNYFRAASKGQSKGYLLVEITDPCARIIEGMLVETKSEFI